MEEEIGLQHDSKKVGFAVLEKDIIVVDKEIAVAQEEEKKDDEWGAILPGDVTQSPDIST